MSGLVHLRSLRLICSCASVFVVAFMMADDTPLFPEEIGLRKVEDVLPAGRERPCRGSMAGLRNRTTGSSTYAKYDEQRATRGGRQCPRGTCLHSLMVAPHRVEETDVGR